MSKKISDATAATALDGTELVPGDQSGGDVNITTQQIAGLAAPFIASAHISGSPIAGGYQHCVALLRGGGGQTNISAGTLPPWTYEAGHNFMLEIDAPTFSAGTLSTSYIELDIVSPDGSNAIAVGVETPISLSSGEQVDPVVFDHFAEAPGAGSDLSMHVGNSGVVSAAGGIYVVSFFVQFAVSSDFA